MRSSAADVLFQGHGHQMVRSCQNGNLLHRSLSRLVRCRAGNWLTEDRFDDKFSVVGFDRVLIFFCCVFAWVHLTFLPAWQQAPSTATDRSLYQSGTKASALM